MDLSLNHFLKKKNTHCPATHVYHELLEVFKKNKLKFHQIKTKDLGPKI